MSDAETSLADDVATSVRISAPPQAVFDHLVDPVKLMRWMGVEADIDPQPGGRFWLNVNGHDKASGTYLEVDRPRRVSFTWGWEGASVVPPGSSTVTIDLVADGAGGTVVALTHSGLPGGTDDQHLMGWNHYLSRLVTVVAGGEAGVDTMTQRRSV